jgi:hypothetical protein
VLVLKHILTELTIRLAPADHLLAVGAQRAADNGLGRGHVQIILEAEMAKPSPMAFNPAASGSFQSVLSVSAPFTILARRTMPGSLPN